MLFKFQNSTQLGIIGSVKCILTFVETLYTYMNSFLFLFSWASAIDIIREPNIDYYSEIPILYKLQFMYNVIHYSLLVLISVHSFVVHAVIIKQWF